MYYFLVSYLKLEEDQPKIPSRTDIKPGDLATIIYTSGTTGKPKGVELTHQNICSNVTGVNELLKVELQSNVSLAFLPWAHVYGQVNELHSLISTGSTLAIVPHRDQILECLQMVKPTLIYSVPVLFNKIHEGIMKAIEKQPAWKRRLFHRALKIARNRNSLLELYNKKSFPLETEFKMWDRLLLVKLREKLGGNIK
jgi:long-chain acyl-CoA synthetase